jgi:hypothetical protein
MLAASHRSAGTSPAVANAGELVLSKKSVLATKFVPPEEGFRLGKNGRYWL